MSRNKSSNTQRRLRVSVLSCATFGGNGHMQHNECSSFKTHCLPPRHWEMGLVCIHNKVHTVCNIHRGYRLWLNWGIWWMCIFCFSRTRASPKIKRKHSKNFKIRLYISKIKRGEHNTHVYVRIRCWYIHKRNHHMVEQVSHINYDLAALNVKYLQKKIITKRSFKKIIILFGFVANYCDKSSYNMFVQFAFSFAILINQTRSGYCMRWWFACKMHKWLFLIAQNKK